MKTECIPTGLDCGHLGRRQITLGFHGGKLSSDGGAPLLRMTEQRTGILSGFAVDCFRDHRLQTRVEHSVNDLIAQRVFGLVLGYEDLNDHDQLRHDPLFAVAVGKQAPEGRKRRAQQGPAPASSATLNRLELATPDHDRDRYKKIELDFEAADRFFALGEDGIFVELKLSAKAPEVIRKTRLFTATEAWTLPVLSRGLLYVCQNTGDYKTDTGRRLICYDFRGK